MNLRVISIFGVVAVMSVAAFAGDKAHAGCSHGHKGHDHAHEAAVEAEELPMQKTCPVMGGTVNKGLYEDYDGRRVYFCCEGCRKPFKEDPAKYIKILEEKGEHIEQVSETVPQKTCPVMGAPIKKTVYTDHEGKRVYFCCAGCINTFKANPAKYLEKLQEKGVQLESI
jgi:YHS domain-containing protein